MSVASSSDKALLCYHSKPLRRARLLSQTCYALSAKDMAYNVPPIAMLPLLTEDDGLVTRGSSRLDVPSHSRGECNYLLHSVERRTGEVIENHDSKRFAYLQRGFRPF